jgi:uncharacterized protein DUF5317
MFLGTLFVLCLVSVPLAGGRLSALGDLRLRGGWLIAVAIGAQIVIISVVPEGDKAVHNAVHLATYGLAAAYAWLNRRVAGIAIAAVGGLCNIVAIAANGGVMPADPDALRTAGMIASDGEFQNSVGIEDARLGWLGDVFAVPASWPVHNVFSFGDVLLVLGVLIGLHTICGSRPARRLGLHPVTIRGVEAVPTGTSDLLLRVATVPHRGIGPGDLLVDDGRTVARVPALPGSHHVAEYAVAPAMLASPGARVALALPDSGAPASPYIRPIRLSDR